MSEEATTTAGTSARRQASSSVQVPRTLASKVAAGSAIAGPTSVCAARWKTASNSPASTTAPTRLGVAEVALDQLDLGVDPLQRQARETGGDAAVEDGHRVAALEQRPRQVRGDEARARR